MTHSPADINRLLDEYGLAPRRALGQNFVADPNTVRKIVRLAGVGPGDTVVEIGPGLGSLTLALIESGADVTAIEIDPGLAEACRKVVGVRAAVVEADARHFDWSSVPGSAPIYVVANLPYNIATGLVVDIMRDVDRVLGMLVLVQTEVAERLTAVPSTKAYGIPSVLLARFASAEIVGRVPPTVFIPRPKVDSSMVIVRRHIEPPTSVASDALARVVGAGFRQRRKMLRRSLAGLVSQDQLKAAGIDPTARAEELDVGQWALVAEMLDQVEP